MTSDHEPRRRIVFRTRRGYRGNQRLGVWKLAYADFVTAMMAFFMVLWLLTQADLKLRSQIALYFRNPGVLPGGAAINEEPNAARSRERRLVGGDLVIVQGDGEEQVLRDRAQDIERAVHRAALEDPGLATLAEQVRVDVDREGLAIEVVDPGKALLFDVSSAELKPGVVALLERMGPILGALPNAVSVAGHTDPRPFPAGSAKTNWQLAFDRADAARRVLERAGLRPGQLERVISCADSDPLVPADPLADENRRLTILARRRTPPVAPQGPVTDELGGAPAAVPKSVDRR